MSKLAREEKTAFKMVLPYLLIIVLLFVYLIGSNIYSSFTTEEGAFTLQNYSNVFTDPVVGRSMINTVVWVIGSVLGQLLLGLLVAL
ncbi:MAG: sugar ABC transporter permease, partial [Mesotoga sp.]|nr:sugar ABC transporter permease [Mesotoga sp.]